LARLTLISDLHLPPEPQPVPGALLGLLTELSARQASEQQHLCVLGDLFSFWIDRKLCSRLFARTLEALAGLVSGGCRVTLLEGNRDFGFGPVLARATGAELVAERVVLEHAGHRVLLLHGDQLLTADRRYQIFKRAVRSLPARLAGRWLPSPLVRWSVRRLEGVSSSEKRRKSPRDMRVDQDAAARELAAAEADVLVHGHTHQAGESSILVSGRPCRVFNLGEWTEGGGTILDWPESGEPLLTSWPRTRAGHPGAGKEGGCSTA
jgi:UDP-2,3-diacylglucosamine hydrolase